MSATAESAPNLGVKSGDDNLLRIQNIQKYFPVRRGFLQRVVGYVKAVDGVTLDVRRGETVGLVGESGCGKSTLGRTILRLIEPTEGRIEFDGKDFTDLPARSLKPFRAEMQMIFQDPIGSLNPRMSVGDIVGEGLLVHGLKDRKEREKRVRETLDRVGLRPEYTNRYPHEFSGGQRQRIGIARALVTRPKLIVADEPVSALDVSIQSQVLNLLVELKREFNLTYLFVAHNLSVVQYFSHRVGVMYLGKLVEVAPVDTIYASARHPYTVALLSAVPVPDPRVRHKRLILKGDVPSPANPPSGCRFHTRCWLRERLGNPAECSNVDPPLRQLESDHKVACHFAEKVTSEAAAETAATQSAIDTATASE